MAIIKPKFSGNGQVKKHGGKANGQKGGFRSGGGGWGGKGAAQGGGQWMFIPAGGQMWSGAPQNSFGKGGQKFGKGGGKHANQSPQQQKTLDKLGKIDAELKVWVGDLPKDVKRGAVFNLFKDVCKPHLFELMRNGTGCVAFKTAEDAQLAIDSFNGSEIDGTAIKVDVWTQKEKKERKEGERPKKSVVKTSFSKSKKGEKKVDSAMMTKIKAVEPSLKAWVGGLSKTTTWKQLKQHFVDNGCEVDMSDLMKPGTACVTFKTEEEVTGAVSTMNGTELDGKAIEVDVWTKPERKEKNKKEEEA